MGVARAVHRRCVVRVAVEQNVIGHLIVGKHVAVAVEDAPARAGLVGDGLGGLRDCRGIGLDLRDRQLAHIVQKHKKQQLPMLVLEIFTLDGI